MKTVIVTGAHGFLGRNVAKIFSQNGFAVHGIGHGVWQNEDPEDFGIGNWFGAAISMGALQKMKCLPDVVVHCAGGGSVGFSLAKPYDDFCMTVDTTATVLEYLRTSAPKARLIYPSSAAVYGCRHQGPLYESLTPEPISPYGVHKLIAEQLCFSAAHNFGLDCRIVRFFSLYGPGLRKQLLWDASLRLTQAADETVDFFGTGNETRDWLHVRDAAKLILAMSGDDTLPPIVNGTSGNSLTVREMLFALKVALGSSASIAFNGLVRDGDPEHLLADLGLILKVDFKADVALNTGIKEYAEWFERTQKRSE